MKLYIADIKSVSLCDLAKLSPQRAEMAEKYKKTADKKRCILGGLLLNRFLGDCKLLKNPYGKPYCPEKKHFNLSHSGDYVILALADCEVGCDIEQKKYINTKRAGKVVFCPEEQRLIESANDGLDTFFTLWTKKESLLKCIGKGFHRPAKSVCVCSDVFEENGKSYFMKSWNFSDCVISVCSEENDLPSDIEFVKP